MSDHALSVGMAAFSWALLIALVAGVVRYIKEDGENKDD